MKIEPYSTITINGIDWKDQTTYSQTEDKIPTTFSTKIGKCIITVMSGHIYYRPEWCFSCYQLGFDARELPKGFSMQEACIRAYDICRLEVIKMKEAFNIK